MYTTLLMTATLIQPILWNPKTHSIMKACHIVAAGEYEEHIETEIAAERDKKKVGKDKNPGEEPVWKKHAGKLTTD